MATGAHSVLRSYDVATDTAGLRVAALELFEESLAAQIAEKIAGRVRGAANEARAIAGAGGRTRSLAGGYYGWVEYLFSLEGMRAAGIHFTAAEMQARELEGLQVVAAAREEFRAAHPGCPACGAPLQNVGVMGCWKCGKRFERRK